MPQRPNCFQMSPRHGKPRVDGAEAVYRERHGAQRGQKDRGGQPAASPGPAVPYTPGTMSHARVWASLATGRPGDRGRVQPCPQESTVTIPS